MRAFFSLVQSKKFLSSKCVQFSLICIPKDLWVQQPDIDGFGRTHANATTALSLSCHLGKHEKSIFITLYRISSYQTESKVALGVASLVFICVNLKYQYKLKCHDSHMKVCLKYFE